jgi:hypothetical protein
LRPRLAILAGAANDVRSSLRRARARRRARERMISERHSAEETKRRLDATRARLRSEIPPRED